jgi:hypothetical protein
LSGAAKEMLARVEIQPLARRELARCCAKRWPRSHNPLSLPPRTSPNPCAARRCFRAPAALFAAAALAGAAAAASAAAPANEALAVIPDLGTAQGIVLDEARAFLSLPFGAPPVGAARFQPPTPAAAWSPSI